MERPIKARIQTAQPACRACLSSEKNVLGSRFGAPSLLVVLFTYYCGVSASSSLFLSKVLIALPKLIFPGPPATRTKSPTNSPTPFGLSFISLTEEAFIYKTIASALFTSRSHQALMSNGGNSPSRGRRCRSFYSPHGSDYPFVLCACFRSFPLFPFERTTMGPPSPLSNALHTPLSRCTRSHHIPSRQWHCERPVAVASVGPRLR